MRLGTRRVADPLVHALNRRTRLSGQCHLGLLGHGIRLPTETEQTAFRER
jgi:hypothetical protein